MDGEERNTAELIEALGEDVERCFTAFVRAGEELKKNKSVETCSACAYQARQVIRVIFAYIEAVTFSVKARSAMYCDQHERRLTEVEFLLAFDTECKLTDKGEVSTRPARIRLADNIRFAFALQERVLGTAETFDANVEWWSNLKTAIKVRDRLMHPKWPQDIDVYPEEILAAISAYEGFQQQVLTNFIAIEKLVNAGTT